MTHYEMTENLSRKCNVTLEEAKTALEVGDWNMLTAGQLLEDEKLRRMQELDEVASGCEAAAVQEAADEAAVEEAAATAEKIEAAEQADQAEAAEQGDKAEAAEKAEARKSRRAQGFRNLWDHVRRLVAHGNRNRFEVRKGDELVLEMPVTVLVLALACMFWLCLPLLAIGLFTGCRYSFSGVDLNRESINGALGKAADAAERVKKAVAEA